jgi:IS30 family transposase
MRTSRRNWVSPNEKLRLWDLWIQGQRIVDISAGLRLAGSAVSATLARTGGIRPRLKRRSSALTEREREEISRGLAKKLSLRCIARKLGRSPSTICREVSRNYGRSRYRASSAERLAWKNAQRPKSCKLVENARLCRRVAEKLALDWSPEQISGWLRLEFASDSTMRVSAETIYRSIFIQARGALKKELVSHLRTQRSRRRPHRELTNDTAPIVDGVSISMRPAEVEDRAVPGHWEGDLLFGTVNSYIATLVERTTRFVLLVKVTAKDTETVTAAIRKQLTRLPAELRKTLTWDRGSEMSGHKEFSVETGIDVYFCDPRSPWQRGSNENTNGLLRQYFPRGKDLSNCSQADLNLVARRLNGRPRKTLGFHTPAQELADLLR